MDLRGIYRTGPGNWIIAGGIDSNQQVCNRTRRIQYWPPFDVKEEQFEYSIYPNPAHTKFQIKSTSPFIYPLEISIIDNKGQIQTKTSILKSNDEIRVDNLPSGQYILQLKDAKKRTSQSKISILH
jgi:hypothetical protein